MMSWSVLNGVLPASEIAELCGILIVQMGKLIFCIFYWGGGHLAVIRS